MSGSGSNVVTANLARTWRATGHDVLLLCQERNAEHFDFVDAEGDFDRSNATFETRPTGAAPADGRFRLARPSIGSLLPVYVYDAYEGFVVKRFIELSTKELDSYVDPNVAALESAIAEHRPDAIFVNHEVMGPYIAKRAGATYVVMIHGSALEYVVGVDPRFVPYAEAGLGAARAVIGGSRYMIERAAAVVPGWTERGVVVNPGCDVELFAPTGRADQLPIAGFVGKLIAAKGPQDLVTALGHTKTPELRSVFVGYGGFQAELRHLAVALQAGDVAGALEIARVGEGAPLPAVGRFLEDLLNGPEDARTAYLERIRSVPIEFTGRLEHGPLSAALPRWDVLVVPSVVPEAFGMVAAEAAASGVLPIVPAHSGIGEAGAAVEKAIGRPGLLTYDPSSPIEGIAEAIDRVLAIPSETRREMGLAAAELARDTWSWERVGERLLEVASSPN
ncbi:MAG: glycosyltransferase family 4 protein [Actinomycetota bacterium]